MLALFRLVVAVLLIAGWAVAAASVHVVQANSGIHVVTKNQLGIADTFVDARHWGSDDPDRHRVLYDRLKQLDKTGILDGRADEPQLASNNTHEQAVKDAWERLNREASARRK